MAKGQIKSQIKSQRPQTGGVTRPRPATIVAARCHIRPRQATSSDGANVSYKRGVRRFKSYCAHQVYAARRTFWNSDRKLGEPLPGTTGARTGVWEGSPERINGPPGGGRRPGHTATRSLRTLAPSSSWTSVIARILTIREQAGPPGALTTCAGVGCCRPRTAPVPRRAGLVAHSVMRVPSAVNHIYRALAPARCARAAARYGLEVMPVDSVALRNRHCPGERAPSRRSACRP